MNISPKIQMIGILIAILILMVIMIVIIIVIIIVVMINNKNQQYLHPSRSTFCDLCADATPRISPKHVERASTS